MVRVCMDIGGTFTDCVVLDDKGNLTEFKAPSTPADFATGVMNALGEAATFYGRTTEQFVREIELIVHGTTVATNALLTRRLAKTALITTKGFRDMLEIRRAQKVVSGRLHMFDIYIPPYKPLVPRRLRFGVDEETRYTGEVTGPLDEAGLRDVIEKLKRAGVEALAICFINSYVNPENERRAAEICRQELPGVFITASSELLPVMGEYIRQSTAVLNACLGPIVSRYMASLQQRLKESGFEGQLLIMQADELMQSVSVSIEKPVYLMNSGPAAAPAGGIYLGEIIDRPNFITTDAGGTSFDMGIIRNREVATNIENWIDDESVGLKMVDVKTVGAGGGSIAWFDSLGLLRVGPGSAGSEPGPACYGRGGEEPTVTDADLILGYIPADYFLGGKVKLEVDLAKSAVMKIANRLNLPVEQAAHAIFTAVNSFMADAVSEVSTKRGYDVRDFSLLAFGGAGPVHAAFIAELLAIPEVIVPKFAATFSAWSMFTMDIGRDYVRSYIIPPELANLDIINGLYQAMMADALREFAALKVSMKEIVFAKSMEMRYLGQFHDVEVVGLPAGDIGSEDMKQAVENFHKKHDELYAYSMPFAPILLMSLRLRASARGPKVKLTEIAGGTEDASAALKRRRSCFLDGGYVEIPIYAGGKLKSGNVITGPAVIEEVATTVVIPRAYHCNVDKYGNYIIRR